MGADNDGDRRVQPAGLLYDRSCLERIRGGHDDQPRTLRTSQLQHAPTSRVAVDGRHPPVAQRLEQLAALLDHDIGHPRPSQGLADRAADAAVTHQNDMVPERRVLGGRHRLVGCAPLQGGEHARPGLRPAAEPGGGLECERIEADAKQRAGHDETLSFRRQQAERQTEGREDEGELTDLGQARGDHQRRVQRVAEQEHDAERGERLADHDDQQDGEHLQRVLHQDRGIEEHADGDEEQDRERVLQRQRIRGGLVTQVGAVDDDPGEEGAQREGHAEERCGPDRDADRHGEDREGEELARAQPRHPLQHPGHRPPSDHHHENDEARHLAQRDGDGRGEAGAAPRVGARRRLAAEIHRDRRQEHQDQHGEEVLDHQPSHGDPAIGGVHQTAVLQRAEEHHRARDREAKPEDEACPPRPAPEMGHARAEQRGDRDLHRGAGQGDPSHRHQVVEREMNPHAEHQQDDADLGQLLGQGDVGDETGGVRADRHAGEEIAHDRRQPQPYSEQAEQEREAEARGNGGDELGLMGHGPNVTSAPPRTTSGGAGSEQLGADDLERPQPRGVVVDLGGQHQLVRSGSLGEGEEAAAHRLRRTDHGGGEHLGDQVAVGGRESLLQPIVGRGQWPRAAAAQVDEGLLEGGEKPPRLGVGIRGEDVDADHRVGALQPIGGPETGAVERERIGHRGRREVRSERIGESQRRGELRPKEAGAQDPDRHVEARARHCLHRLSGLRQAEPAHQLHYVLGEGVGRARRAAQGARRQRVRARCAPQPEVDPSGVERSQGPELLRDDQRRVVREHDPAGSYADGAGARRDMPDHHRRRGARHPGHPVVLRQPEAVIAPALRVPGEVQRVVQRPAGVAPFGDGREVEDRERRAHDRNGSRSRPEEKPGRRLTLCVSTPT